MSRFVYSIHNGTLTLNLSHPLSDNENPPEITRNSIKEWKYMLRHKKN